MGRRRAAVVIVAAFTTSTMNGTARGDTARGVDAAVATARAVRIHAPDDPWFTFTVPGLTPGTTAFGACCPLYPVAAPPTVTAWAAAGGVEDGLLLMTADPTPSPNEQWAFPQRHFRPQPDGSLWSFEAWGFPDAERNALADLVTVDSAGRYVLAADGLVPLAHGLQDLGDIRAQVYAGESATRSTLTVGAYRGQFAPFVWAVSVRRVTISGGTGFAATDRGGNVHVVWPVRDRWATIDIPRTLAERVDEILAAIRPRWSWEDVSDEKSANGTTWGGPWEITGTWDGTTFTLTQPPHPVPSLRGPPLGAPSPDCDQEAFLPAQNAIFRSAPRLFFSGYVDAWDGRCGITLTALLDSAAVRQAVAPYADQIASIVFSLSPVN